MALTVNNDVAIARTVIARGQRMQQDLTGLVLAEHHLVVAKQLVHGGRFGLHARHTRIYKETN